jgi:hypothetical protein
MPRSCAYCQGNDFVGKYISGLRHIILEFSFGSFQTKYQNDMNKFLNVFAYKLVPLTLALGTGTESYASLLIGSFQSHLGILLEKEPDRFLAPFEKPLVCFLDLGTF